MSILISFLSEASIILGIVAFVGLMMQKKPMTKVFEGTIKTIVGFLIFNLGGSTITTVLKSFNTLFQTAFHINGVVAMSEAAVALAKDNYGTVVSVTFIVAFVSNLLFARFTKFKNIVFLTSIQYMFGAMLALVIKSHGYSDAVAIVLGGVTVGFASAFLPELCQPFVRKITGSNEMAIGHFSMCAYALSGCIGKLFKKHESETTEDLKLPGWLSFFKDFTLGMTVIMLILYYVSAFVAGEAVTQELAGSTNWLIWPFIQALTFTAGMNVLMYGVRMFLAEITAAFISISEKVIPNARPALDCPTLFPYAPTAVMLGFLSAYIASLIAAFGMARFNAPVVFIPAANVCFFLGGTAGVFGNSTGGWRGAIAGSFVTGLLLSLLPLVMYPVLASVGVAQSAFPAVDYNVTSIILHNILNVVDMIVH